MNELQFAKFNPVGRKAVLLLNRPPLNILNQAMCEELTGFLKNFTTADFDGLLIATELPHFSAGADIDEHFPGKVWEMLPKFDELLLTLAEFPLPTVAAITGSCLGGGLELARACHWTIALNPETMVLGVPEIKLACFPPFGLAAFPRMSMSAQYLPEMIRFLLTGMILKGQNQVDQAQNLCLIDEIYVGTLEQFVETSLRFDNLADDFGVVDVFSIAESLGKRLKIDWPMIRQALAADSDKLSALSHHALNQAAETLIQCAQAPDLKTAMEIAEHNYLAKLANHRDYREGLTAHQMKRPPIYVRTGL